jgi:hypothetical protein
MAHLVPAENRCLTAGTCVDLIRSFPVLSNIILNNNISLHFLTRPSLNFILVCEREHCRFIAE